MVQARVGARLDEAFMDWKASDFAPGEFARPRGREPTQTGKMTWRKLAALIKAGYGQGHFQRYKPWLRVTKRDYSPNSNIGHLPDAALARAHHYRARTERGTMLILRWLGATDVRDAFPIWPWPHRHPGFGLPGFERSMELPGLLSIANAAGFPHGYYLGTAIPYVATLDLMVTREDALGSARLVALENKPESIATEPDPLARTKERLELARRYCAQAGIPRVLIHAEKISRELIVNLDLLAPQMTNPQQSALLGSTIYRQVSELLQAKGHCIAPSELIASLGARFGHRPSVLQAATHLAIWRQDVDHDLTIPFMPWLPLVRGGRAFKHQLQSQWFGGSP